MKRLFSECGGESFFLLFKCDGFVVFLFEMGSNEERFCIYFRFFFVTLGLVGLF